MLDPRALKRHDIFASESPHAQAVHALRRFGVVRHVHGRLSAMVVAECGFRFPSTGIVKPRAGMRCCVTCARVIERRNA